MPLAIDFGTCNTVIVRWNSASSRVETVSLGSLSRTFACRIPGNPEGHKETVVTVIPSLIHYGEGDRRLLGEQVNSEGLTDHPGTFRWMKLDLLRGNLRSRRVDSRRITPGDAAAGFVRDVLTYARGSMEDMDDEIVLTVPVEAYDHYVDWMLKTVEGLGFGRVHVIDEATACILGYQARIKDGKIYMIIDFGGGTLDCSVVKADLGAEGISKCHILGRAGEELGGTLVDKWMLEHMKDMGALSDQDIQDVGTPLLRQIEEAKIALSGGDEEAEVTQLNDIKGRLVSYTFRRRSPEIRNRTGGTPKDKDNEKGLEDILRGKEADKLIARTINRALDAANERYGTKTKEIESVFLVGGSSLLLGVRDIVMLMLTDIPVQCADPFTSIAAGACRYAGQDFNPTLVHEYCLKSWSPEKKDFELVPVIAKGTQYPTGGAVEGRYISTACDGATELGMVIWERSEIVMPGTRIEVGDDGRVREAKTGDRRWEKMRELNPWAKGFLRPVPSSDRDEKKRFVAGFGVDDKKRLTISLKDNRPGNSSFAVASDGREIPLPIKDFPLVRL